LPRLSPGNSWRCWERWKLVAAAVSDGVYRRARLEEMLYKVKDQMPNMSPILIKVVLMAQQGVVWTLMVLKAVC
jgi:hypothetical protein